MSCTSTRPRKCLYYRRYSSYVQRQAYDLLVRTTARSSSPALLEDLRLDEGSTGGSGSVCATAGSRVAQR